MPHYREFWREFLKRAPDIVPLYQDVVPKDKSYLHTKKGNYKHFCTAFTTRDNQIWVENCLQETGPGGEEESNRKFDHFYDQRDTIEQQYGEQLDWMRLPEKKRSRILSKPIHFDYADRSSWNSTIDQLLEKMTRFIPVMEKAALGIDTLQKNTTIRRKSNKKGDYVPIKIDADFAAQQLTDRSLEAILDQIEKNLIADGKQLKDNWRMITKENIKKYWYK